MPRVSKFTEEQRAQILAEYRAAPRDGGRADVAKKYEISPSTIASWGLNGVGRQTKRRRSRKQRSSARLETPAERFIEAVDAMIAYHQEQIAKLRRTREEYVSGVKL